MECEEYRLSMGPNRPPSTAVKVLRSLLFVDRSMALDIIMFLKVCIFRNDYLTCEIKYSEFIKKVV